MPEQAGDTEVLPCGCKMYTVGDTFAFEPHALDCPYYEYVLKVAEEQNKPVTKVTGF